MTTWSKTPPSEPGWYWWRTGHGDAPMPQWWDAKKAFPPWCEFGPRIPSPEAISALEARLAAQEARIEAAKDALREASERLDVWGHKATIEQCNAALAKLEGRS